MYAFSITDPKTLRYLGKIVAANYRRAKADIIAYEKGIKYFTSSELSAIESRIAIVDHVVEYYLNEDSKRIINHMLKGDLSDRTWYLDYYSSSTYYRLKNIALLHFINGLMF